MSRPRSLPVYRALLKLYPKRHRQEYGEQMVQTLDDLLADYADRTSRAAIWARVVFELPGNLLEEHIQNIKGLKMKNVTASNKKRIIGVGIFCVLIAGAVGAFVLLRSGPYQPTTLAKVPRAKTLPACLQTVDNPSIKTKDGDDMFIGNAVATSIVDVPAGTNVNAYFKTYDGSTATGSAVYGGKYGSYNFAVKKDVTKSSDPYLGGWEITKLEACKA